MDRHDIYIMCKLHALCTQNTQQFYKQPSDLRFSALLQPKTSTTEGDFITTSAFRCFIL